MRGWTQGGYSDSACLVMETTAQDVVPIAVAVVVTIVVLCILGAVIIVLYKRQMG